MDPVVRACKMRYDEDELRLTFKPVCQIPPVISWDEIEICKLRLAFMTGA